MASVIAERLVQENLEVVYLTPDDRVSPWSKFTDEQYRVQKRLIQMGVTVCTSQTLASFDGSQIVTRCSYTDQPGRIAAESLVLVTARTPNDRLYYQLTDYLSNHPGDKQPGVTKIGDCDAPNIIAEAVFAGHKFAREFDLSTDDRKPFKVDKVFYEGGRP